MDVDATRVVPAQLDFLAIYNPSFGDTDETAYDQIFFFYSRQDGDERHNRRNHDHKDDTGKQKETEEEEKNQRLRQVGLARGMVEFAK